MSFAPAGAGELEGGGRTIERGKNGLSANAEAAGRRGPGGPRSCSRFARRRNSVAGGPRSSVSGARRQRLLRLHHTGRIRVPEPRQLHRLPRLRRTTPRHDAHERVVPGRDDGRILVGDRRRQRLPSVQGELPAAYGLRRHATRIRDRVSERAPEHEARHDPARRKRRVHPREPLQQRSDVHHRRTAARLAAISTTWTASSVLFGPRTSTGG